MRFNTIFAPAALMLAVPACFAAEPLSVKGVHGEMDKAQAEAAIGGELVCSPRKTFPRETCSKLDERRRIAQDTYAGEPAQITYYFDGDKVAFVSVLISSDDFEAIGAAIRRKWGEPSARESEVLTTRMGVEARNVIEVWSQGRTNLRLERYAGRVGQGQLTLNPGWAYEAGAAAADEEAKEAVDDL